MKHKRILKIFLLWCVLLGYGIIGWIAFMHPDWLLLFGSLTSIPGYCLLLVCFTPIGNICLGEPHERLPWTQWLMAVAKGHVVLAVFTIAVFLGFFGGGPGFISPVNFVAGLTAVQEHTRWQWGIFPWGVYGLWGLVIAYMAYVKKGPPYLYALFKGSCPKWFEPSIKTFVEATQFATTSLALTTVACAIILLLSYFFEKLIGQSHFTLVPITFSFLSLFVIFFSIKSTRVKMRYWREKLTLRHLFSFCIIGLAGLLILGAVANQWLIQRYPQIVPASICHQCGDYFRGVPQETRFAALYWGWWLVWVPLGGSYLAKLSQGRTLRQFVLGLYAFPLGLWLIKGIIEANILPQSITVNPSVIFAMLLVLPFLVWWMLITILKNAHNSGFFLSGYMLVPETFPRNRLWVSDASKIVGLSKYSSRVMTALFGTLFFHTTAGWYGIQVQLTAVAAITITTIYGALIFGSIRLYLSSR